MKHRTDTPSPSSPPLHAGQILRAQALSLPQKRYAVETRCVQEVHPLKDLTPLPGPPPFVLGVVNVLGRITPMIDIERFCDLPDKGFQRLKLMVERYKM